MTLLKSVLVMTLAVAPVWGKNSIGPGQTQDTAYNQATVVHFKAVIADARQTPAGTPLQGIHIIAKTKTNTFDVYLGPADFIKFFKTTFEAGDQIEVIGSVVKTAGGDVVLTREITQGMTTLILREDDGAPLWKYWGVEAGN